MANSCRRESIKPLDPSCARSNWLSRVVEQDLGGFSSLRRPSRKECPAVLTGRGVGVSDTAAMLSGSTNISGDVDPVGCLERASAALCRTPGMWIIQNLLRRVFSFRSRSLAFEISSRDRSPKILSKGLWSTAMMRLVQPSTKKRALSRASATARASHSTGA